MSSSYLTQNSRREKFMSKALMSTEPFKVVTVSSWACILQAMDLSSHRLKPLASRLAEECHQCKFAMQL